MEHTKEEIISKYGECEMRTARGGPWFCGGKGEGWWVYEVSNSPEPNIRFQGIKNRIYQSEHEGVIKVKNFEKEFDTFRLVHVIAPPSRDFLPSYETLFDWNRPPSLSFWERIARTLEL